MKIGIILGIVILILITGFGILKEKEAPADIEFPIPEKEMKEIISSEEKELIEAWILENDLNQFGDPKDTVYTGGTPLFDEKTGKSIDKYEYILKRHPDRPWGK